MIKVDGKEYAMHVVDLKRNFKVIDRADAGRDMAGNMHREPIGTFYNYTMILTSDINDDGTDYDRLYDIITDPRIEFHNVVFPRRFDEKRLSSNVNVKMSDDGCLAFKAYVAKGTDEYDLELKRYTKLNITFIAQKPQVTVRSD